jgi:hypothetical protein
MDKNPSLLEALRRAYLLRPLAHGTRVLLTDRTGVFTPGEVGQVVQSQGGLVLIRLGAVEQLVTRAQIEPLEPEVVFVKE